jgi:dTDP-4-amino-4,6-dideoxygalactose transaminase
MMQELNIQIPIVHFDVHHSYHLYVVELDNRDQIRKFLSNLDIETKIHYPKLIIDQIAYRAKNPNKIWHLPEAVKQSKRILSLPIHQNLSENQIDFVSSSLAKCI